MLDWELRHHRRQSCVGLGTYTAECHNNVGWELYNDRYFGSPVPSPKYPRVLHAVTDTHVVLDAVTDTHESYMR